jgi:hypothetical protein
MQRRWATTVFLIVTAPVISSGSEPRTRAGVQAFMDRYTAVVKANDARTISNF